MSIVVYGRIEKCKTGCIFKSVNTPEHFCFALSRCPVLWSGGVCRVELRGVTLGVKTVFLQSRYQGGGAFSGRAGAGARLQEVTCGVGAKLQHPACRACSHADGDQVMSQPRWLRGGGAGE